MLTFVMEQNPWENNPNELYAEDQSNQPAKILQFDSRAKKITFLRPLVF